MFRCLFCLLISVSHYSYADTTQKVVLHLKWQHAFQFAGYYAAKSQGYYQEAGLEVQIRPATPDTQVVDEVTREVGHYGVSNSSLVLEHHAGKPVVVVAVIFQHSPAVLVALEKHASQGVHSIVDKKIMLEPHSDEILAYLLTRRPNNSDTMRK